MIKKITYEDKIPIKTDKTVARKNKITAEDINEIKEVVNANAESLQTNSKNIESLIPLIKENKGEKGEPGKNFSIFKTYLSINEMELDKENVEEGNFVLIASSVEDEDNAKLYVKGAKDFTFLTDLSGAQGIKGEKGEKGDTGLQGIQGERGPQGLQGIQGPQGLQGKKGEQGEKGDQGIRGLQGEKGEQGIPGPKGDPGTPGKDGTNGTNGKTSYFHIKYSAKANPITSADMSEIPNTYIGTYVDFTQADSTDPTKYTWSQFKGSQGAKGDQGIHGTNGINGKTSYLHIAYANSADGKTGFSVSDAVNKLYIGQYTDFTQADSTDPAKYSWTKIKGEQGATGAKGDTGKTGPQGPQGEKGDIGPQGAQGPQGIQGEKGEKGEPGSPGKNPTISELSVITTKEIIENTNYEVPQYIKGNNSLSIFYEGTKLIKNVHYEEVDTTHVKFLSWNVPAQSNLEFIVRN